MKSRVGPRVSACWIGLLLTLSGTISCMSSLTWQVSSSHCLLSNNVVLQHLRQNGVGMLHHSSRTNSHCKAEWGTYGTCCDPEQALRFINEFDRKSQKSFQNLQASFDSTIERMKGLLESTKKYEKLKAKDFVQPTRDAIEEFNRLSKTAFNKEVNCFASIRKIIGATVCAACSTRSNQFFGNAKVHISEDDCRSTISYCGEGWRQIFKLQNVAHRFAELLKAKLPDWFANNFMPLVPTSQNAWTNNLNLEQKLSECQEPLNDKKCGFATAKSICEHMISIFQPSYISKFSLTTITKGHGSRKLCGSTTQSGYTAGSSSTNSTTTSEVHVEQKSKPGSGSTINTGCNEMP